jgi:hypothetical protein
MATPAPLIDSRAALLLAEKNFPFSHQPAAINAPTLWEASGLPPGLTINAGTGLISGTATAAGLFVAILRASNYDARTFTADATANTLTSAGSSLADADSVTLTTTGTLPAPLTTSDTYTVRDFAAGVLKLSATAGGDALDLTTAGTGTHTIKKKQSHEITTLFPIPESSSVAASLTGEITVEIDVDVITGKVTVLGAEAAEWGPPLNALRDEGKRRAVLAAKSGDRFPISIGFTRGGILQDFDLNSLKIGAKEFAPDGLIDLTPGGFEKTGSGSSTRYTLDLVLTPSAWAGALSNAETDSSIYVDAFGEIQLQMEITTGAHDSTQTTALSPSLTGGTSQADALVFTGLPVISSPVNYSLAVDVAFPGRPAQDLALALSLPLTWNGATFTVGTVTGSASATGPDESAALHWQATLAKTSITGTASGINLATLVSASEIEGDIISVPISTFGIATAEITNVGEPEIFWGAAFETHDISIQRGAVTITIPIEQGDEAAAIMIEIVDHVGVAPDLVADISDVFLDVANQAIVFILAPGHVIDRTEHTNEFTSLAVSTYPEAISATPQAGTVTAQLVAAGSMDSYRKTSETFILRAEKDMVPSA